MANPWDSLATEVLATLRQSVADLVDLDQAELQSFLKEKAEDLAKQTWITVNPASSEAEKATARENIRHLKSQVILEAMDLKIVATARVVGLLSKVFETVGNFLIQHGPKILAAAI